MALEDRGSLKAVIVGIKMKYQPNFTDPRVRSRAIKSMGFACGVMSETKPHPWSTRYIDKYFGVSSNPLSRYLRETLLTCTDESFKFNIPGEVGVCKKYILNKEGMRFLKENLKISNTIIYPIVLQVAQADHKVELDSGNFTYDDKTHRLWHPLQRYRKQFRTQILAEAGYTHDYDIACCAPTLIHQYAQHLGMEEYLFTLRDYLSNKTKIRNEIAREIELPVSAVKEIINALFAGATIANNDKSDIYEILNGDRIRIEYLKQNKFIKELRKDIKTCWEYIRPVMQTRTRLQPNGKQRLCKITPKQKWNVYFELERIVLNSVRTYLEENSIKHFLIHDGWVCDKQVNEEELKEHVKMKTRFNINFDYQKFTI